MRKIISKHIEDWKPQPPITIYTVGDAIVDLRSLMRRIKHGDTPGTRELLAILDVIRMDIEHQYDF